MQMPRTHAKEIVRLNSEEMKELLAEVDSGSGLSGRQKAFHERTRPATALSCTDAGNRDPRIGMCRTESG